jgi:hypothetical protein
VVFFLMKLNPKIGVGCPRMPAFVMLRQIMVRPLLKVEGVKTLAEPDPASLDRASVEPCSLLHAIPMISPVLHLRNRASVEKKVLFRHPDLKTRTTIC